MLLAYLDFWLSWESLTGTLVLCLATSLMGYTSRLGMLSLSLIRLTCCLLMFSSSLRTSSRAGLSSSDRSKLLYLYGDLIWFYCVSNSSFCSSFCVIGIGSCNGMTSTNGGVWSFYLCIASSLSLEVSLLILSAASLRESLTFWADFTRWSAAAFNSRSSCVFSMIGIGLGALFPTNWL